MGRASTTRKPDQTPRKSRRKKDTSCTVTDQNSTAVAGKGDKPRRSGAHEPRKTLFDIQETEGQGLSVLLDEIWRPAIWHHEAVAGLDKEKHGAHLYDHEPVRRNENPRPGDTTTFLARQKSWGFETKDHRPDILFQLYPNVDQYPNRHEPVPWLGIEVDGAHKVVLDILSRSPLRDFTNIPFQLASDVEGGRLEAMCREDCRIATEDFLQRMIPLLGGDGEPQRGGNGVILHERPPKKVLQHLKTQFRYFCRGISWNSLHHDSEFDKRLLSDLTSKDKDGNTTKNLPDLGPVELTAIRSAAKQRRRNLRQANESRHDENVETDAENSDQHFTSEVGNQSDSKCQSSEETIKRAEACNAQASCSTLLDPVSIELIEDVAAARRHRQERQSQREVLKEAGTVGSGLESEPSSPSKMTNALQNGSLAIYPAPNAPTVPTLPTQDPLTKSDTVPQSCNLNPHDTSTTAADTHKVDQPVNENQPSAQLATAGGVGDDDLNGDQPAQNNKDSRIFDSDAIEVVDEAQSETESSMHAPKRQKILPPAKDRDQVLNGFSAGQRAKTPTIHVGGVETSGSFSDGAKSSFQHRAESPKAHSAHEATRPLPKPAPLSRPPPHSSVPPASVSRQEQARIIQAEQSRFASVSVKVSSLEILKTNLTTAWWNDQVDTSTGGGLYGHRLNISLSRLGPSSSARTDAEMRMLLTWYAIPVSWSASSIDLRQNQGLRQLVHEAMCDAERWDERNYRKDFPGHLDLSQEGGFFLAPAQQSSIKPGDSRFVPFTCNRQLNASLHSAMWRYRQLTGRDFASPKGPPAFGAVGAAPSVACSYHDAWCEIRRQVFLPYFLRFRDPVEALAWTPELGMLSVWEGGPELWERSRSHVTDDFGSRYNRSHCHGRDQQPRTTLDPTDFVTRSWSWTKKNKDGKGGERGKVCLPLVSVDLEGYVGGGV